MAQYRVYFSTTDSGYLEFGTEQEAQDAYDKLLKTHCTVEELGRVYWDDLSISVEEPVRFN